jgi:hypothetical protein
MNHISVCAPDATASLFLQGGKLLIFCKLSLSAKIMFPTVMRILSKKDMTISRIVEGY